MQYTQYPDATQPAPVATFNRASAQSIKEATEICNHRGSEYSDSWSLDNLRTPWLDNLFKDHNPVSVAAELLPAYRRLVVLASMLDIKLSRLGGGYKSDTALDSINYLGAYNTLRCEFDKQLEEYARRPKAVCNGGGPGALNSSEFLRDIQNVKSKSYV